MAYLDKFNTVGSTWMSFSFTEFDRKIAFEHEK